MSVVLAAISHVGFAVLLHATPIPRWLPYRPISCGFCMTIWFGAAWWTYLAAGGLPLIYAVQGLGLTAVAAALAVGYLPWAFKAERQPEH